MDKYIGILGTLLGTITGFILGLIKEKIQNKSKVVIAFKDGKFNYYYCHLNSCENNLLYDVVEKNNKNANMIIIDLNFNIANIGKCSIGISELMICMQANESKLFFNPKIILPFENKDISNTAFNINANSILTCNTTLEISKDENNEFLFNNISYDMENKKRLLIKIMAQTVKGDDFTKDVEAISILTAA